MNTKSFESKPEMHSDRGFLSIITNPAGQTIEIDQYASIGRAPENTVILHDEFASGRHARIIKTDREFHLRDMGSSNGTFLNGAQVLNARLRHRDRIRIGNTQFLFSLKVFDIEGRILTSSRNSLWNAQLQRLPIIAQSNLPVLITGPSGSGKEVIAQALHQQSQRATGPMISVNCSALSETLVESELFGHTKGSFTGATENRKGAFAAARGGTLFLDEIGDLPINLQPKLLRALENSEIKPVGADSAIDTDVRIIAATHKNIRQQVVEGKFREDLFYRLHVVQLSPPSLVDRLEDFEDLLYFFAQKNRVRFSLAAIEKLKDHDWPGNIRELKNAVARAAALIQDGSVEPDHVPMIVDSAIASLPISALIRGADLGLIQDMERQLITDRLTKNHGNQRKTARELGMAKSTLHDRIRNYGIDVKALK